MRYIRHCGLNKVVSRYTDTFLFVVDHSVPCFLISCTLPVTSAVVLIRHHYSSFSRTAFSVQDQAIAVTFHDS